MPLATPSYEQLAVLVVEQAATIERLEGEVVELRAEVVDLKRWLARNSRNSSRPPSSDGLSKPSANKSLRRPSGRKPSGQPGHQGGHLEMAAVAGENVDHVSVVRAACQAELSDELPVGHLVRQVFDLPEIRLRSVEHHAHTRRCVCDYSPGRGDYV